MFKSISSRHIFILGLSLIAIGLTLSPALMSIGQFVLLLNWIIDPNFFSKLKSTFSNKYILAFLGIFIIHILGLIYTSNFQYALKDIRIKLPLLIIPLVVSSSEKLNEKELKIIFYTLIASVFSSSLYSTYLYFNIQNEATDTLRSISPIISHIRFSLITCIAFFICIYLFIKDYQNNQRTILSYIWILLAVWFFVFIGILGARAGYLSILIGGIYIAVYAVIKSKKYIYMWLTLAAFIILPVLMYQLSSSVERRVKEVFSEIDNYNRGGNPTGHSVTQRFVYWKIALELFKEKPLLGQGTGDIDDAFKNYYATHETPLAKEVQFRAHNQYFTIICTFGIVGFIFFLFGILFPYLGLKLNDEMLASVFMIILLLSMLTEDTLETQAGATFFAYFYSLFILNWKSTYKR